MAKIQHSDLVPVANGLIIAGLLFGNFPYDFKTLYTRSVTEADFLNSLRHYQTWAQIPRVPLHILHTFLGLGIAGLLIKIYKPNEDAKYFEYSSLFLYVVAICIYLTNLKTGADSALAGEWGEVDQNTGINVIAASEAMIIFLIGGVLVLQAGLYYGEWEYQQRLAEFNREQANEVPAAPAAPEAKETAEVPVEQVPTEEKTTSSATKKKVVAGKRRA